MPYPAGTAGYHAGSGWDPVTGWGTPNAHVLVPCWPARLVNHDHEAEGGYAS